MKPTLAVLIKTIVVPGPAPLVLHAGTCITVDIKNNIALKGTTYFDIDPSEYSIMN